MTVFGVCRRIDGSGFEGCVEFGSVAFSGVLTIIGGKNMGTGIGFSIENCQC